MNRLFLFNPGHDLAFGNGDPNFVLPASAERFAGQCAGILLLLADPEDYILTSAQNLKETAEALNLSTSHLLPTPVEAENLCRHQFDEIIPWGWDAPIRKKLQKLQVPDELLPSEEILLRHRRLAHRRTALQALSFLHSKIRKAGTPDDIASFLISELPQELTSPEAAEDYLKRHQNIVFKAPWSGSGKGLRWCRGQMSHSDQGWVRNTIASQGSIMGEIRRNIRQDFAMEFHCEGATGMSSHSSTVFCGYSLFSTRNGSYVGNLLAGDDEIEQRLSQYLPISLLRNCREALLEFITAKIAPHYSGYIGVDMFIYQEDRPDGSIGYRLNPVVEMNLRITMGLLFNRLYQRLEQEGRLPSGEKDHQVSITWSSGKYQILIS